VDNYFLESLGSKIKILRKSRGVSQEDLAKQSEITRTYLTQIENG
jgi:transcriptional regulator with XRE-family HTH domain